MSFVKDGLNYPYIIEKVIDAEGMRDYFELSFSSIYFLINTLEEKKYIETFASFGKKKIQKKAIRLTDKGEKALRDSFMSRFLAKPILSHPIDYLLYNCHQLTPLEIKSGLNQYIKEAERIHSFYKQKIDEEYSNLDLAIGEYLVIKHFLYRLKAEIEWAKDIKFEIQSMKDIDSKFQSQKDSREERFRQMIL